MAAHRVRHPGAVRQGVRRRHHQADARRTSAMPSSWATASSCWASPSARAKGIELRVHPTLVPARRLIANVEGAMNAVLVQGRRGRHDAVLRRGRRRRADGVSAVIADLVDVTRLHTADPEHRVPHLAFQPDQLSNAPILPIERGRDRPTTCACACRPARRAGRHHAHPRRRAASRSTRCCRRSRREGEEQIDIIMLTHRRVEKNVNAAIAQMEALPTVRRQDHAHPQGRAGAH